MNIDTLEKRNIEELNRLRNLFNIDCSVEDLISFNSVFKAEDKEKTLDGLGFELQRQRLIGTERITIKHTLEDGSLYSEETKKLKKHTLFTLRKKVIDNLDEVELNTIITALDYFTKLITELKMCRDIKMFEKQFEFFNYSQLNFQTKF